MKNIVRLISRLFLFGFFLGVCFLGYRYFTQQTGKGSFDLPIQLKATPTPVPKEELVFDASMYPYYDQLSDTQKALYGQMYSNALNMQESFAPEGEITKGDVETVFRCVTCDHPELFWLSNKYTYQYLESSGQIVAVNMVFNETADDIDAAKTAFNNSCNTILVQAQQLSTDYEKEKYVHDTLITMTDYNSLSTLNQSAYSCMVNHSTVCAGYARSFQYLMQQLNIPCYYVIGTSEGVDHAWNIVLIDESFYNVDVTWDDCSSENDQYYFFNLDDGAFDVYHTRANMSVSLPNCTSTLLAHLEDADIYQRIRFTIPK